MTARCPLLTPTAVPTTPPQPIHTRMDHRTEELCHAPKAPPAAVFPHRTTLPTECLLPDFGPSESNYNDDNIHRWFLQPRRLTPGHAMRWATTDPFMPAAPLGSMTAFRPIHEETRDEEEPSRTTNTMKVHQPTPTKSL